MKKYFTWNIVELDFNSQLNYVNPYLDVEMEIILTAPDGRNYNSSGFWDGENKWKVRFAPPAEGLWKWICKSSNSNDNGLNGLDGEFFVEKYDGENPVYKNGFLRVSSNGRGFSHADGTPFFWLGDTVWAISAKATVEEWKNYISYRNAQGFNVAQINSLPQNDASISEHRVPFDSNDGKYNLDQLNPDYFKYLDRIMEITTHSGMYTAMIVLWCDYVNGTHPSWDLIRKAGFTIKQASAYGKYLGSRYAAYGTIWLISGDTDYVLPEVIEVYDAAAFAINSSLPYKGIISAHLNDGFTPEALNQKEWFDFHMIQSGHNKSTCEDALRYLVKNRDYTPERPIINGEPSYEDIGFLNKTERVGRNLVRKVAWYSILGGGNAGLTYGAHGMWSWHRLDEKFRDVDDWQEPKKWEDALQFEGANDVARMKRFFSNIEWWELEPINILIGDKQIDMVSASTSNVIISYICEQSKLFIPYSVDVEYKGEWFNPVNGEVYPCKIEVEDGKVVIHESPYEGHSILVLKDCR